MAGSRAGTSARLETVFGTVSVERLAYRAPGVGNLHPADAALNLPVERHSHGLRKLAALEAPRGSFDDAVEAIERQTGQRLGQTPGRRARRAGRDGLRGLLRGPASGALQARRSVGALGRRQGDRDAPRRAAHPRPGRPAPVPSPSPGCRASDQRYTASGWRRSARSTTRRRRRAPWPTSSPPRRRRATSLPPGRSPPTSGCAPASSRPPAAVIERVFDEAERRDPKHRRTWVALVDGANHQIQRITFEANKREVKVTIIVDFVHVLQYLWNAAGCLHPDSDQSAAQWVHRQATTGARRTRPQGRRRHPPPSDQRPPGPGARASPPTKPPTT